MAKINPYLQRTINWKTNYHEYEHRLIIEKALGHSIPKKAVTHHIDGDPKNNSPDNLILCQNQKYHYLLHLRENALKSCGNKHWRKCIYCSQHDNPATMKEIWNGSFYHRECNNANRRKNRRIKKAQLTHTPAFVEARAE